MTTNKHGSWIASAAVLALTLGGLARAQAEDGKVYPASFCAGALVGNPPIISYVGGKVTNTSTSNSAVLVCPALKDNVTSVTGINEAFFRYYKADSTGFLVDLYAYSSYGTSSYVSSKSDFAGAGYKVFSWAALSSYSQGFYEFIVVIPPSPSATKSAAMSYRIDEND